MSFKITNILPFAIANYNGTQELCIALKGCFASSSWCVSDEAYHNVLGRSFEYVDSTGRMYTDDKRMFSRPTEEDIHRLMNPTVMRMAVRRELIQLIEHEQQVQC